MTFLQSPAVFGTIASARDGPSYGVVYERVSDAWKKVMKSYEALTYDYFSAARYVAEMPKGDRQDSRRNILAAMLIGGETWSTDKQGRNYTLMVCMPRDLRRYSGCGPEPLWVVDISSSQPLMHLLLYRQDCEEKRRYQTLVESGEFLEFMNRGAGEPYDLESPSDRSDAKKQIFKEVFYGWHEDDYKKERAFATVFSRAFPILWGEINAVGVSKDAKRFVRYKASGPFAREMQHDEALAVAEAVAKLKDKPYPLITIHDAIATTLAGVADVEAELRRSYSALRLTPRLPTKRLTV